jgi:hypothetical protein
VNSHLKFTFLYLALTALYITTHKVLISLNLCSLPMSLTHENIPQNSSRPTSLYSDNSEHEIFSSYWGNGKSQLVRRLKATITFQPDSDTSDTYVEVKVCSHEDTPPNTSFNAITFPHKRNDVADDIQHQNGLLRVQGKCGFQYSFINPDGEIGISDASYFPKRDEHARNDTMVLNMVQAIGPESELNVLFDAALSKGSWTGKVDFYYHSVDRHTRSSEDGEIPSPPPFDLGTPEEGSDDDGCPLF